MAMLSDLQTASAEGGLQKRGIILRQTTHNIVLVCVSSQPYQMTIIIINIYEYSALYTTLRWNVQTAFEFIKMEMQHMYQ